MQLVCSVQWLDGERPLQGRQLEMVSSARRAVYPRFHLITITIIIIIIFVIVVVLITITTTIIVIILATVALYPRFHLITRDGEEDYAMGSSGTSQKESNVALNIFLVKRMTRWYPMITGCI